MTSKYHGVKPGMGSKAFFEGLLPYETKDGRTSASAAVIAKSAQAELDKRKAKKAAAAKKVPQGKRGSPYTQEFIDDILRRHAEGKSLMALAKETGIPYSTALNWKHGTTRTGSTATTARKKP